MDVLAVDEFARETDFAQPFVRNHNVDVELPFERLSDRRQRFGPEIELILLPRKLSRAEE